MSISLFSLVSFCLPVMVSVTLSNEIAVIEKSNHANVVAVSLSGGAIPQMHCLVAG